MNEQTYRSDKTGQGLEILSLTSDAVTGHIPILYA